MLASLGSADQTPRVRREDVQTPASLDGRPFVVSGDRLAGYDPTPPPKRPYESWMWRHREAVTHLV